MPIIAAAAKPAPAVHWRARQQLMWRLLVICDLCEFGVLMLRNTSETFRLSE
jgi:uncharacterized membrane protein